ncbi:TIR domain-containing protein [Proteus sp. STS61-E]|uniref:TIR domain-containing protein n=1 Tax=Proteus sp. STS61-E TaxID=3237301 RepID=UPI0034C670C5
MTFINVCLIFIFFMIVILLIRKQKKQKKQKNIFISYSTRDGIVTKDFLEKIHEKIKEKVSFNIYIDLLHNRKIDKQSHVIKKLLSSDYLVLLKTEYTDNSEWVQFELSLFNSMEKEIIELNIEDINENNTLASENMDKFLEKLKLLE